MNKGCVLIFGSGSQLAKLLIQKLRSDYDCLGLSSKIGTAITDLDSVHYSYDNYQELVARSPKKLVILASRLPSENCSEKEFFDVNDKILCVVRALSMSSKQQMDIIFCSTTSVYKSGTKHIHESSPTEINSFYVNAKLSLEEGLSHLSEEFCHNLLVARLPTLVYPGVRGGIIKRLADAALEFPIIEMSNPNARCVSIFDDISLARLIGCSWTGVNYVNCVSNGDMTFDEIAGLLSAKERTTVKWGSGGQMPPAYSTDRLQSLIGRVPSSKETLQRYFNWYFGTFT